MNTSAFLWKAFFYGSMALKCLFPLYDHIDIVVEWQVSQVVHKVVDRAFFGGVEVGDKIEIEAFVQQLCLGGSGLAVF